MPIVHLEDILITMQFIYTQSQCTEAPKVKTRLRYDL